MPETTADNLTEGSKQAKSYSRFLALPFELRAQIIKHTIGFTYSTRELEAWRELQRTGSRSGWEIKPENFTISSAGLKCHFMTSFNLALVNKQLRHEALSIIFQNSTVCIHVHIPRYGPFSSIPRDISKTYRVLRKHSMLLEVARDITLIVDPQPERSQTLNRKLGHALHAIVGYRRSMLWDLLLILFIELPLAYISMLAARISNIMPFQGKRHTDLQALVDFLVRAPSNGTHTKTTVYLNHMHLQDLSIVLTSLKRCGPTTFEEVWASWHYHMELLLTKKDYEKDYKNLVMSAAGKAGCAEILSIPPEFTLDETAMGDVRGTQYIGRNRRTIRG